MTKVILVILDGWGWSPMADGNLLLATETPGLDTLFGLGGWTLLRPASLEVGLPWGSVGDSELGHLNMGSGRIVVRHGTKTAHLIELHERGELMNNAVEPSLHDEHIRDPKRLSTPSSLGSVLSTYGLTQLKIAAPDKLLVLTQAFNGYPTHALTNEVVRPLEPAADPAELLEHEPVLLENDLIVINLSAADLAAHAGDMAACRRAIRTIDDQLKHLTTIALEQQAILYITADHGNIEQMLDINGHIDVNHTTSPVALLRIDFRSHRVTPTWAIHARRKQHIAIETPSGLLADVAPTVLEDFHLPAPEAMVGISLQRVLRSR